MIVVVEVTAPVAATADGLSTTSVTAVVVVVAAADVATNAACNSFARYN